MVVRREWRVRVAESLGPQKVDVPDTVGSDVRVAALQLRRAGLEIGSTARLPYAGAVEGTVLAQDPPAHAQGIERPGINLLVAAPANEIADGFVMPDLTGLTMASAQAELGKVGLKSAAFRLMDAPMAPIGSGNAPPRPPAQLGAVLAQQPSAGSRVDQGTLVKLTVAK
jgi:beta-lactam-binding protein with PASTA domain